jgi:hypothetical protein
MIAVSTATVMAQIGVETYMSVMNNQTLVTEKLFL